MNVQVVCNAKQEVANFVVRYPTTAHDSFIWINFHLRDMFQLARSMAGNLETVGKISHSLINQYISFTALYLTVKSPCQNLICCNIQTLFTYFIIKGFIFMGLLLNMEGK